MKTDTKNKILKLLSKRKYSVTELSRILKFSSQMINRNLNDLQEQCLASKKGKALKVFYFFKNLSTNNQIVKKISHNVVSTLEISLLCDVV